MFSLFFLELPPGGFTDTALRQEEVKGPVQHPSVARAALSVELKLEQFHCSKLSLKSLNSGRQAGATQVQDTSSA